MFANKHTDVIGSILRPSYLLEAGRDLSEGRCTAAEYKAIADRAVDEAIALQEGCGLDFITDGEMRRIIFTGSLTETVAGIEPVEGHIGSTWYDQDGTGTELPIPLAITGKLRARRSLTTEEFSYARSRASAPLKVTLPSPMALLEFWSIEHSPAAYVDIWEAFADATDILRSEAQLLASLGCTYIQIDDPYQAITVDERQQEAFAEIGAPPARIRTEGMEMLNSIADIPGAHFALHTCRGNWAGKWMSEGGYERISREVFSRLDKFETVCLEYDDYRSGSFEPLRGLPDDKRVVLGLVSTKRDTVEVGDDLAKRIDEAATYFPKENLAVSTQCGFAPVNDDKPISVETQTAKLMLIRRVANQVWG